MIYSVWKPALRQYDYYQDSLADARPPVAKHLKYKELGIAPEDAAWPLPSSAKKIGSGTVAKGMVASTGGLSLGDMEGSDWLVPVGFLIAAYGLYRLTK